MSNEHVPDESNVRRKSKEIVKLKTLKDLAADLWVCCSWLQHCTRGEREAAAASELSGRGSMMHRSCSSCTGWRLQGNPITAQLHCCAAYRGVRVLGNLPAIGIICAVALAGYGNALQPSANQFLQVISFLPHVPSSLPPVWKYAHENNFWTNLI